MWDYFDCQAGSDMTIEKFFNMDKIDMNQIIVNNKFRSLKHVLFHDFGLPLYADEMTVENKIKEIDEKFDFIMILEEFVSDIVHI